MVVALLLVVIGGVVGPRLLLRWVVAVRRWTYREWCAFLAAYENGGDFTPTVAPWYFRPLAGPGYPAVRGGVPVRSA